MHAEYLVARIRTTANRIAESPNHIENIVADAFHLLADELEDESAREDMRRGYDRPMFPAPGRVWDVKTRSYGPYARPNAQPEVGSRA